MSGVLAPSQRRLLEQVVAEARDVVEAACDQRVAALGVADDRVSGVMTESDRRLRRGLRARARQLGSVDALVSEAGFEHWHRMLFARFLADNGLLVDDVAGQPVSVEELAEVAAELGEQDRWEVAARFAAAMLPGIFRFDDPVLQMRLPAETRQRLEDLLATLPSEVLTADDALGWVYQYWQARRKDEVNRSERKIGGADLAPVTQLFTEDYMVRFLLENSLGAWWAARHPESPLLAAWEYLRFTEDGVPAAGTFDEWPSRASEVTVMDPCCGSGHFLVAAFGMLCGMRVEEEGLSVAEAQDAVLRDNLFGLELDARCTQIAAFALALEAWKTGGYRQLPVPQVACSGIPAKAPLRDWTDLAGDNALVESALRRLHALFVNADTLGSLIDPVRAAEDAGLESVDWHDVAPLVQMALTAESGSNGDDPTAAVFGEAAAGIARAADLLSAIYTLVITNPPWLGINRMSEMLSEYVASRNDVARQDLALSFTSRLTSAVAPNGATSLVLPGDWLSTPRLADFRRWWLTSRKHLLLVRLGEGSFSGGIRANPVLYCGINADPAAFFRGFDITADPSKSNALVSKSILDISSSIIAKHPRAVVSFADSDHNYPPNRVSDFASARSGLSAGDSDRFERYVWEVPALLDRWEFLQGTVDSTTERSGRQEIVLWERERGSMASLAASVRHLNHAAQNWRRGKPFWGMRGISMNLTRYLRATLYDGDRFGVNCAAVVPEDELNLPALWCFARSGEWERLIRSAHKETKVSPGTLVDVPFDVHYWRSVAEREFPDGLPQPFSSDATQWLFSGAVVGADQPLLVAIARLLGFRWPNQEPDDLDVLSDRDGVVCVPAVGGEEPVVDRLLKLLGTAYGNGWTPSLLNELLARVGGQSGKAGLEAWLRNGFFKDHCRIFGNRPFIWQVWDGEPAGFSALVNYHRLDRALLERLTYDYLGSWWIGKVRDEAAQDVPGAAKRLVAAELLRAKLTNILEGEPPFDIFVRWKSLAEQPLGWDPDLDDGVRMNIRPFMAADVLRAKPNIKWTKDRGKNLDGSERVNDLHYTLAQKRAARGATR